jgi:Polyketide cyclase / dehydrase and lipid transport
MSEPALWEQSRAIPVSIEHAFGGVLAMPVTRIFRRRYLLLPPIKEVGEQSGDWARAGETRRLHTGDGGTMLETLTEVLAPTRFAYRLSEITGPLKPLTQEIEGDFGFAPAGTGTKVTWRWKVHPCSAPAGVALRGLGRMWNGYARQALEELEAQLLR